MPVDMIGKFFIKIAGNFVMVGCITSERYYFSIMVFVFVIGGFFSGEIFFPRVKALFGLN
ncbi:MAG: hypothetical protein Fur0025_02550 [Oscillatoriaceae cyanobacterium]